MASLFTPVRMRFEQRILDELSGLRQMIGKMDGRFEAIDKRFEQIDERFVAIDKRFDQIDERFAAIDKRFEGVDKRFAEMDERFARMDNRFDQAEGREDILVRTVLAIQEEIKTLATKQSVEELHEEMLLHFDSQATAIQRIDVEQVAMRHRNERVEADVSAIMRRMAL